MPSQLFVDQILIYKNGKTTSWHSNKTISKFPDKLYFLMSTVLVLHLFSSFMSLQEYLIYLYFIKTYEKIVEKLMYFPV